MQSEKPSGLGEILVDIYQNQVLSDKTRRVRLLGRRCMPRLQQTLLGFEVRLGKMKIHCPDLVTAKYLGIFAEIGLAEVSIPYNPVRTAELLPRLEASLKRFKAELHGQPLALRGRRFRRLRDRLERTEQPADRGTRANLAPESIPEEGP